MTPIIDTIPAAIATILRMVLAILKPLSSSLSARYELNTGIKAELSPPPTSTL